MVKSIEGQAAPQATQLPGKDSPERSAFNNMLARCRPGRPDADRYYDRGVRVCARWDPRQGGSFANFYEDMGPHPGPGWSLDKDGIKPGNLLYAPEFCRWATRSEQSTARRNTVWLTYQGQTLSLQGWADKTGIPRGTLMRRLSLNWETSKILETPVDRKAGRFKGEWMIECKGEAHSLAEWSRITGVNRHTIAYRLRAGWTAAQALELV